MTIDFDVGCWAPLTVGATRAAAAAARLQDMRGWEAGRSRACLFHHFNAVATPDKFCDACERQWQDTYRNHCTHCVLHGSASSRGRPRRQVLGAIVTAARRQSLPALQCTLHTGKFKGDGDCGQLVRLLQDRLPMAVAH